MVGWKDREKGKKVDSEEQFDHSRLQCSFNTKQGLKQKITWRNYRLI